MLENSLTSVRDTQEVQSGVFEKPEKLVATSQENLHTYRYVPNSPKEKQRPKEKEN